MQGKTGLKNEALQRNKLSIIQTLFLLNMTSILACFKMYRREGVENKEVMGKIIAIVNQKGGVGKTTTSVNLAAGLAVAEQRTLLVDMDPQSNATTGIGIHVNGEEPSVYQVMLGQKQVNEVIQKSQLPFLDVLPSNPGLVGAEVELISAIARERILKNALSELEGRYDFIIIDCPPSLGLLTLNSLTAADSLIIPIQCEYYALEGLGQLLNTVRQVQKSVNKALVIEGVVMTMFDSRLNLSKQVVEEVKSYFKDRVYKTFINRNVRLSEAPSFGKPIILYDATSTGAVNYMNLVEEMLERA